MEIRQSTIIQQNAAKTWNLLGERFGEVSLFASSIQRSSLNDPLGVGGSRSCEVPGPMNRTFAVRERLIRYEPSDMSLDYVLEEPGRLGLRRAINRWSVSVVDDERCWVNAHATAELRVWLWPLYPFVRFAMHLMGRRLLEELKHYAEHGRPHPRKLAAMQPPA